MGSQEGRKNYFDMLSRRNWATWAWATITTLGMNLALFTLMPYLLTREPARPSYERFVHQISVIRIKRPETPVQRQIKKRPERLPEKKRTRLKPANIRPVQTKLSLPFEINPRLPAAPTGLTLPPMERSVFTAPPDTFTIGQLDAPLTSLARMPPVYPFRAKRRGIEGWATVRFLVDEQGNVNNISMMKSEPPGVFDKSVIKCVSTWRFEPGTVAGEPVKTWVETTIRFELE